ncbi:hypothetical protein K490DRAFT_67884, partial [Saccharata proteae CBS 121410]
MGNEDLPLSSFLSKLNFKLEKESLGKNLNKAVRPLRFSTSPQSQHPKPLSTPKLLHTTANVAVPDKNPHPTLRSPSPEETRAAFKTQVAATKAEAAASAWAKAKPFVPASQKILKPNQSTETVDQVSTGPAHGLVEPLRSQPADSISSPTTSRQPAAHKFNLPVENLALTLRSSSLKALNTTMAPLNPDERRKLAAKEANQHTADMVAKHDAVTKRIQELRRLKRLQQEQGIVSDSAERVAAWALQIARQIAKPGEFANGVHFQVQPDIAEQSNRVAQAPVNKSQDLTTGLENQRPSNPTADVTERLQAMRLGAEKDGNAG